MILTIIKQLVMSLVPPLPCFAAAKRILGKIFIMDCISQKCIYLEALLSANHPRQGTADGTAKENLQSWSA